MYDKNANIQHIKMAIEQTIIGNNRKIYEAEKDIGFVKSFNDIIDKIGDKYLNNEINEAEFLNNINKLVVSNDRIKSYTNLLKETLTGYKNSNLINFNVEDLFK